MKLDRFPVGAGPFDDSRTLSLDGAEPVPPSRAARQAVGRPVVVVIEDDRAVADNILDLLTRSLDCDVRVVATGGIDGLSTIADIQPQVVVAGLAMLRRCDLTPADFTSRSHSLILIDGSVAASATDEGGAALSLERHVAPRAARFPAGGVNASDA
jgi:hypothetical protein